MTYTYDTIGRITAVGDGTTAQRYAIYTYDTGGRLATAQLQGTSSSITRTFTYESRGWLSSIADTFLTETLRYERPDTDGVKYYDGRIAGDALSWAPAWAGAPASTGTVYDYDTAGRLTVAQDKLGDAWSLAMGDESTPGYDPNGNILTVTRGKTTTQYAYAVQGATPNNRLQVAATIVSASIDFESASASLSTWDDWSWFNNNSGPASPQVVTTQPHTGTQCLQVPGGALGHTNTLRLQTYLAPLSGYTLTYWTRTGAAFGAGSGLAAWYVTLFGASGMIGEAQVSRPAASTNWTSTTATIDLGAITTALGQPEAVSYATLEFRNARHAPATGGATDVFLDDISVNARDSSSYWNSARGEVTQNAGKNLFRIDYPRLEEGPDAITFDSASGDALRFYRGGDGAVTATVFATQDQSTVWGSHLYLRDVEQRLCAELVTQGAASTPVYYLHGPAGLIGFVRGTALSLVLQDHLGSTRLTVDAGTLSVQGGMDFLPFGGAARSEGQDLGDLLFLGAEREAETGLYVSNGVYDPDLGRHYVPFTPGASGSPYRFVRPDQLAQRAGQGPAAGAPPPPAPLPGVSRDVNDDILARSREEYAGAPIDINGMLASIRPPPATEEDESLRLARAQLGISARAAHRGAVITDDVLKHKMLDWEYYQEARYRFGLSEDGRPIDANGKPLAAGEYMFTLDVTNQFRFLGQIRNAAGTGWDQFRSHSQLAGGVDVYSAGRITVDDRGRLVKIDNSSGHYRPSGASLIYTAYVLRAMHHVDIFPPELRALVPEPPGAFPVVLDMFNKRDMHWVPSQPKEDDLDKAVMHHWSADAEARARILDDLGWGTWKGWARSWAAGALEGRGWSWPRYRFNMRLDPHNTHRYR